MKTPPFEPVRLLDQPPHNQQGDLVRLIRHAIGAPEKPAPVLKGRIRLTLRRRSATRRRALRALLVGGAIFISGGVVGAVVHPILRLRAQSQVEPVESVAPGTPGRRARSGRTSRPPGAAAAIEPAPEPSAPLAVPPTPAPASEISGSPSGPTVDRSAVPSPSKVVSMPARSSRPEDSAAKSALFGRRISEPTRALAEQRPVQLAMREPPRNKPPVAPPVPAPLQPPAFTLVTAPAPAESADQASLRPAALLASPPMATSRPSPASEAPAPAPAPARPPASEQTLMTRAISSLRVQHRPATALAALDEYEARFPKGSMLAEAARLRAEALLLLGQRRAALEELSREPAAGVAMDEESRLVRGELRASAGRWREAFVDFDTLVSTWQARDPRVAASPKLQGRFERALWGRACARGHLGDEAGSRADLQTLLLRFPQGRFAPQASRRLGEPQPR